MRPLSGARRPAFDEFNGADDRIRTGDPNLGKVVLYQLSHVRAEASLAAPPGADKGDFGADGRAEEMQGFP